MIVIIQRYKVLYENKNGKNNNGIPQKGMVEDLSLLYESVI